MVNFDKLILDREGWSIFIDREDGLKKIKAFDKIFPYTHPVAVYLKLLRTEENPDLKYRFLKAAHDYLWPHRLNTWNYWTEDRFREFCAGWKTISWAGGANIGKSVDAALLAILFWLIDPKHHAVIVMSTTLESLQSRVYGYVLRYLKEMAVPMPFKIFSGNNPLVAFPATAGSIDRLHSIAAIAAKQGDDDKAISNLIGRHPERGLLIVADEGTDLNIKLLGAIPNLSVGLANFKFICIGNSNSKYDLHGMLSTPKEGWGSIDPLTCKKWETTQEKGLCMYFNPYDSPAIFEADPERKQLLGKFLFTEEKIKARVLQYGKDSASFYRFCLGLWKDTSEDPTVLSSKFMAEYNVSNRAQWGGIKELQYVAGLDPAFSYGGDSCILRLACLGTDINGRMLLDYKDEALLFKLELSPTSPLSMEKQIGHQVLDILYKYRIPLSALAIDCTGQGRAIGDVIQLMAKSLEAPIKIYSSINAGAKKNSAMDLIVMSTLELWSSFREFVQTDQIRGLDAVAVRQLTDRLIVRSGQKKVLESKSDYMARMGGIMPSLAHSPDEADAATLALQAAIRRFGFSINQMVPMNVLFADTLEGQKLQAYKEAMSQESESFRSESPVASFGASLEDSINFIKNSF